jgi:8-oxo-dGTP pyrophosphatase MutT (NUDIX family)
VADDRLINLVKYHDANLPWYQAAQRGEPPSEKAWNRLARKVDMRLLCLFMVADRVDCPGGWRANRPVVWFLEEVKRRDLLQADLVLDDGPEIPSHLGGAFEVSAGVVLIHGLGAEVRALLIRVREEGYEAPKGHVELDEDKEAAALRELREETAIISPVNIGPEIGVLDYTFEREGMPVTKHVHFFAALVPQGQSVQFGEQPKRTKELRWVKPAELAGLPLVNEELRSIVARALDIPQQC